MATRIVRLPGTDSVELRDRLADAIQSDDDIALVTVLDSARQQLQDAIETELHRLVGEMVVDVSAQRGLREKAGRAIALGSAFLDSLPPPRVLRQLADADKFVARCRAACDGLITFLAGELNLGLQEDGHSGLPPAMARRWVEECADHLRLALERTEVDGIDRRSQLAGWFAGQFDEEDACPSDRAPTWLL